MSPWPTQIPLATHAWLPLGLAASIPLAIVAAFIPLSRRRARSIATVLALRTVLMLGVGFAILVAVATVSVVHAGLSELRQRQEGDVRALARELDQIPHGRLSIESQLRLTLFRAKNASAAFVAIGEDGCGSTCLLSGLDKGINAADVRRSLAAAWPSKPGSESTITVAGQAILLVAEPLTEGGATVGLVVVGINADYLVQQATRTAWILLAISYGLVALVGWSSWQQLKSSLVSRINAITSQIRKGSLDEPIESLKFDGHELRELAESVSNYIRSTLDAQMVSDERYKWLVELAPDGVVMCSKTSIKFVNSAALSMAGARSKYDVVGVPITQFLDVDPRKPNQLKTAPRPGRWTRIDGTVLQVEAAEIANAGEDDTQYLIRDVTVRHHREQALAHRAEHDPLTGLANRARFEARLGEMLDPGVASQRGMSRQVAVLFIDLDGFKPVNDTYGHAAGDAVLVAVAERLRDATRGSDLVARLGGDEFAVLLEMRDHEEVTAVSGRILSSLERPIMFEKSEMRVGASIGIADTHVGDGAVTLSPAELLHAADQAMYTAKQNGGNRAAA